MSKKLITIASLILLPLTLLGCDGGACPTVAIPIYSVTVYNSVTGEIICAGPLYNSLDVHSNQCTVIYDPIDRDGDGRAESGDFTFSAEGFETQVVRDVANKRALYQCFDSPYYTTDVKAYLMPAS